MPEPERVFDFLKNAERLKCMSRSVRHTLLKDPETKNNEPDGDRKVDRNVLFTKRVLEKVFTENNVVKVLRCPCQVCEPITRQTPPDEDDRLANDISKDPNYQMLLATLAFMGGTFAVRQLDEHTCDTIEKTLDRMPKLQYLRENLFQPFRAYWNHCPHDEQHLVSREPDSLICLERQFLAQLRSACWIVRVPSFQADNLLRRFGERHNMPFVNQIQLNNGDPDRGRSFYKFEIHQDYCDEKLRGRLLFRKQLAMSSEKARQEIDRESAILRYLKDVGNPNIAEVLFAFQEEYPPSFSLVFDYHPTDLRQILYEQTLNRPEFDPTNKPPNHFVGSCLDHWLWVGVLGVFDAVAAVHEPQRHTQAIPETATTRFLGGHFDIKPANILIDESGRFLLTDFGQAYFKKVKIGQEAHFTVGAQTQNYIPPPSYSKLKVDGAHNVEGKRWWTQEYDLWGLACVCAEVLAYIVEGKDAPTKFHEDRVQEDPTGVASFWKAVNGRDVIKKCVYTRLSLYKRKGDEYLTRVLSQVEEMFRIQRDKPMSVKACHQELSASVKVDRYLFKSRDDKEIAGEGTYVCLKRMRTSFSTERVSQMRCSLYLWANTIRNKTTLTLEFFGSESQCIVTPGTTKNANDEIIPISMFDTNTLFEANRFRTNGPFLQCAFRTMHDGVTFHFAKRRDFNHFFGAVTHQHVRTGSEFRLRGCQVDVGSNWSSKTFETTDAHLQIWEDLRPDDYASRYINPTIPTITADDAFIPKSPTSDDRSSTNMSVRTRGKKPEKQDVVYFRLVLYLKTPCALVILVISLNHNTFYEIFDENNGKARMILERRSGQKKIFAAVYEREVAAPGVPSDLGAPPQADDYPGIPLDTKVLAEDVEKDSGLKRVKMDFWGSGGLERFKKYYAQLKK